MLSCLDRMTGNPTSTQGIVSRMLCRDIHSPFGNVDGTVSGRKLRQRTQGSYRNKRPGVIDYLDRP